MTTRQKYGLRVALRPSNALEAITFMDRPAVQDEIKNARAEGRDAHFTCVNAGNDEPIDVFVVAADIQMVMHHKWSRPAEGQIAVPRIVQ